MRYTYKPRCAELLELVDDDGALSFWAPEGGGYIRLERIGKPGTLGMQICERGGFSGNTLSCGKGERGFRSLCCKWARDYVRNARREG